MAMYGELWMFDVLKQLGRVKRIATETMVSPR